MSLGWGLRGYIGGGPFGAMIPGALVALLLCQYLGYSAPAAAAVAAFGALGVGFGGIMTYGQTLGLLREADTFWWGLLGTTLKGAVWGLLGGAILGLGFLARHISWRSLAMAFVVLLIGAIVGIHFINEPKLIYFSNPVDKPREESWAGLLFGSLALLACLRVLEPKFAGIPARFAAYGAIGGAIGFGGGCLLLAMQGHVAEEWRWLPYWKFMEFTFGFIFGAALGICALHMRDRLASLGNADDSDDRARGEFVAATLPALDGILSILVAALVVVGVFYGWRMVAALLYPALRELPEGDIRRTCARVLLGFTGSGCVRMLLSRRWPTIAWQTAVSVTIFAAAIDWQADLLERGNIDMPAGYRHLFLLAVGAVSIVFVAVWQRQREPKLMDLFLFATCFLMGIGYANGLAFADIWWSHPQVEEAAGGRAAHLWQRFRGEVVVHSIFSTLFVISLWAGLKERQR